MEMEIVEQRENTLLKRKEVEFIVHHPGEQTPKRDQVRELVATRLKGKKENVVVEWLDSEYGRAATKGYAKLYENAAQAKSIEREHLLVRNGIVQPKKED